MKDVVHIRLEPLGATISVQRGTPLQDVLFSHGVEFPCGGQGKCKGCRVRVMSGRLPVTPEQERMLSREELEAGWRLSCQCVAADDLTLEMAQWEAAILSDETSLTIVPRSGLGVALDVGTTTLVAQLLDLRTGNVLGVRTALNPQARHGADIMSRVSYAVADGGQAKLVESIRKQTAKMIGELIEGAGVRPGDLSEVVLVGNTVMHHLFCDIDLEPLSHYPFEPPDLGNRILTPADLGWDLLPGVKVEFLSCIGGFVGSDILAGLYAKRMHESSELVALVDLGTNGEIVVGNRERLISASTAAGPAFEGARIYMGMRAATGAVSEVHIRDGGLVCHVLGNVTPRGICGSGLVDAVACALDLGLILPGGRFTDRGNSLPLSPPVKISQTDVRELQLAKGAIAAGIRLLLREFGAGLNDVSTVYLAGAFGNYINIASAERIGLLAFPQERVTPAGNTALLGAKLALFSNRSEFNPLARRIEHVTLSEKPDFQDIYVEEMIFPDSSSTH
jgi:uncharacterized 2Fe-2S/4Fe-4S cluster protein (DUF4445 family)